MSENNENKHTISDLYQMQALSLPSKVAMTRQRIKSWVDEYGEDGVYVSFSGGKDSTVLLDIVRKDYPNIKATFVDTGLEYPEIRQFVKTFDNVDWLKPKMNFRQVIEKYGYPFISKEVAECVYGARKFLSGREITSIENSEELESLAREIKEQNIQQGTTWKHFRFLNLMGEVPSNSGYDRSQFNCSRYNFFLDDGAPPISHMCCNVMKKSPMHTYARQTGRKPITAQTASESRLRTQQWLKNGCNGFDMKNPISNPMAFWAEQDVLTYIYENQLPIASVYGDVVIDYARMGQIEGQMSLADYGFDIGKPLLKTTGCNRTGCVFCGFGCHLEKGQGRFERLKETHPQLYEYIMKPWEDGGLNYKEVIDWINEHGNLNIKY